MFFSIKYLKSQDIGQYSLNSANGEFLGNIQINYTIGQIIVDKYEGENILCSGIQDAMIKILKKSANTDSLKNISIKIYPNPAKDKLNIFITSKKAEKIRQINLISDKGEVFQPESVIEKNASYTRIKLDLSGLSQGVYVLQILFDMNKSKSLSFIKI